MPQLIIPKPIYQSQLNPQKLFHLSDQNQDINNLALKNSLPSSKKINGAFQLYKQKKYRNKDCKNISNNQVVQLYSPVERKIYKLVSKKQSNQSINNLADFSLQGEPIFDYFDPNIAPTFVEQENKDCYLKMYRQKLNQSIEKKQIQNQQRILFQKKIVKETEPQEFQNYFIMVPQQAKRGDPFIIMKKANIKNTKNMKKIENLPNKTKKNITKKNEYTSCRRQIETLYNTKLTQQSFKKQKQRKRQELASNLMPNQCSLNKEQSTESKQRTPNDKEIIRQTVRGFQDIFSGPRLILHLQLESQSNLGFSDFESLGQKEVLPLIK